MKYSIILILALTSMGCTHQVAPVQSVPQQIVYVYPPPPKDNFDKAGQAAADSSRWIWDKAGDLYRKVTSEEYKKMYAEWYASAKRGIEAIQNPPDNSKK